MLVSEICLRILVHRAGHDSSRCRWTTRHLQGMWFGRGECRQRAVQSLATISRLQAEDHWFEVNSGCVSNGQPKPLGLACPSSLTTTHALTPTRPSRSLPSQHPCMPGRVEPISSDKDQSDKQRDPRTWPVRARRPGEHGSSKPKNRALRARASSPFPHLLLVVTS
jgi:hypothetical protein